MKKFSIFVSLIALLFGIGVAHAQIVQPAGVSSSTFNTPVSSTPTTIISYDNTNMAWTIHPEDGAIRCTPGGPNGATVPSPTPSASMGVEFANGGYFNNGQTNPQLRWDCVAETGTVHVSGVIDHK